MLRYVIKDLWGALRFLPVGVGIFAVLMLGTGICNRGRKKKGKKPLHFEKGSCLIAYGAVILMHDAYQSSVDAALQIVDLLMKEGYKFVTVDKLILP